MHNSKITKLKAFLSSMLAVLILVTLGMLYVAIRLKSVTITYLGKDYKVRTLANTVRGVMNDKKVFYDDTYQFKPELESYIKKGQNIIVSKTEEISKLQLDTSDPNDIKIIKIEEITTPIDYEIESRDNDSLIKGREKIIQEGKNGEKTTIYKTVYSGDTPIDKVKISENITDPVKKIVEVGTKEEIIINNNGGLNVNSSDLDVLARVIYAEARGEPYLGQVAVGAVIINRVKSTKFPNSVYDVVYAAGQFSTVRNGQINKTPSNEAYNAANEALSGVDPSNGALYFYNPRTSTNSWIFTRPVLTTIGNHCFAR